MGDDIPDLGAMKLVGMPTCPNDATNEVQAVSRYISNYPGGYGCVRDVIEQVLRTQGFWNYQ
jgi:3-deoxy-D-manno-octulosonate 8-phosphate phosphatase (KDO 8-P phosphatase)